MVSRDGGRSFGEPWQVARHPQQTKYYWDQRLCPTQNPGEFVGMFWTHNRPEQRDTNVHLLRASIHDEERAAAEPFETSIPGQIAACALTGNGRILSCVVDRGRPGTITLWQSADDGQTWPEDERLVVHVHDEQAAISQGREEIDYVGRHGQMELRPSGHPPAQKRLAAGLVRGDAGSHEHSLGTRGRGRLTHAAENAPGQSVRLERLVDLAPGHGLFEVGDAFRSDQAAGKMQHRQLLQPLEMSQPLVADRRPGETEILQTHQALEMHQSVVADLVIVQHQPLKLGQPLEMFQSRVCDRRVGEVDLDNLALLVPLAPLQPEAGVRT